MQWTPPQRDSTGREYSLDFHRGAIYEALLYLFSIIDVIGWSLLSAIR